MVVIHPLADGPGDARLLGSVLSDIGGKFAPAAEAKTGQDGMDVIFDGGGADPQMAGDVFVRLALQQALRHLALAGRQPLEGGGRRVGDDDRCADDGGGGQVDLHMMTSFGQAAKRGDGTPRHGGTVARRQPIKRLAQVFGR